MENLDLYEVSRDEYVGFIQQINPSVLETELYHDENNYETKLEVYSNKTNTLLAMQIAKINEDTKFYVINMPEDDERISPPAVRRIELQTPEEVKAFFEVLNKIQKGECYD